jgi:predicted  nucleic acid-binding Zn-ribbon protein
MHPSIEKLLHVQGVDKQIRFLTEAKRLRPVELSDERKKLAMAKASLDVVLETMKAGRLETEKGEHEIKQKDAEIEKAKIALNTARTNQEYSIFNEQISRHEDERGAVEERVLEYLTQLDILDEKKAEAQKEYADQEKAFGRKEAEVGELVSGLEAQIGEQNAERDGLVVEVDPDHLELYDRILNHVEDAAITGVKNSVCQGCFRTVTKQDISQLMLSQEILQCRSCSRLLFLTRD